MFIYIYILNLNKKIKKAFLKIKLDFEFRNLIDVGAAKNRTIKTSSWNTITLKVFFMVVGSLKLNPLFT